MPHTVSQMNKMNHQNLQLTFTDWRQFFLNEQRTCVSHHANNKCEMPKSSKSSHKNKTIFHPRKDIQPHSETRKCTFKLKCKADFWWSDWQRWKRLLGPCVGGDRWKWAPLLCSWEGSWDYPLQSRWISQPLIQQLLGFRLSDVLADEWNT